MRVIELAFIRGVMAALLDVAQVVPVGNAGPIKLLPGKNRAFVDFIIEQFAEKGVRQRFSAV